MWLLIVVVAVVVLLLVFLLMTYNGLIGKRNQVSNAWSQIDVQLKRRHDLVPNLVNAVKGYMAHEQLAIDKTLRIASAERHAPRAFARIPMFR